MGNLNGPCNPTLVEAEGVLAVEVFLGAVVMEQSNQPVQVVVQVLSEAAAVEQFFGPWVAAAPLVFVKPRHNDPLSFYS